MPYLQKDKFKLYYEKFDSLVPCDTIFLHGNLSNGRWFHPTVELLKAQSKDKNYSGSVILFDWRGCGNSTEGVTSEEDLTIPKLADDIIELVKHLNLNQVNLVGHSTGGLISLFSVLNSPELFNKMVLLDPVGATGAQFDEEFMTYFTKMSEDREFCAAIMSGTVHNCNTDSLFFKETVINGAFNVAKPVWHGIANNIANIDIREQLKTITHPTLVLHGEHDQVININDSKFLAENVQNGKFHEIKNHGHSTNAENPQLFVKLFSEFLYS